MMSKISRFLLSQSDYISRLLDEYRMADAFEVQTPVLESERRRWDHEDSALLDDKLKKKYQPLIRSLLYLMHGT